MTNPSILEVESAVRAVLRERSRPKHGENGDPRVFADRLLSLRQAEALPPGIHEVCVTPGTVITPLARDHLKRLGIAVKVVSRSVVERSRDQGEWGFAVERDSGLIRAFRRTLLEESRSWLELEHDAVAVSEWVAESLSRGAVLITEEASVAVWKACLTKGVRAASAHDVDAVDRAVGRLGVNLLVVEPWGKSISLLKQMSQTFRRSGAPKVPDGLE